MLLMMLGEVVFGGTGCGLYGMLGFAIMTVFIAGLMVGRTPEYLGKKIEPYEMKMACVVCLATPVAILIGSGIAAVLPSTLDSLNNPGAHGLSEILYAYSSAGGNNGSAFAGFGADTLFINISLGLVMAVVRFVPDDGGSGDCRKSCQEEESGCYGMNTVHQQCNVYRTADFCSPAGWGIEFLPGRCRSDRLQNIFRC